jgi:hypothetical protein
LVDRQTNANYGDGIDLSCNRLERSSFNRYPQSRHFIQLAGYSQFCCFVERWLVRNSLFLRHAVISSHLCLGLV